MKYFLLLSAFILLNFMSFAQFEDFDLSKYKLPDIKRHQLDFNFQSQGQNSSSFSIYEYGNSLDTFQNRMNNFQGESQLNYSFYKNSSRVQIKGNAYNSVFYSRINKHGSGISSENNSDFNSKLYVNYDVKFFSVKGNWFFAANPEVYLSYLKEKDFLSDLKEKETNFRGTANLGVGKGRIEQVQDFRHAILLLQELTKRGVTKRNLLEEEIIELSSLISDIKNKRFFDSRKRKEIELIAIDSFLVNKGVVDDGESITYFVGLEDIWRFGALQVRESGNQLAFLISPEYHLRGTLHDDNYTLEYYGVGFDLKYLVRKPLSIKWQTNYDFGLDYEYTDVLKEEGMYTSVKKHFTNVFATGRLGFFPNTRTSFFLFGSTRFQNGSDDKLFNDEKFAVRFQLSNSAYYYISERFRVGYSIWYHFDTVGILNNNIVNSNYHLFYYDLNLNYAIF